MSPVLQFPRRRRPISKASSIALPTGHWHKLTALELNKNLEELARLDPDTAAHLLSFIDRRLSVLRHTARFLLCLMCG